MYLCYNMNTHLRTKYEIISYSLLGIAFNAVNMHKNNLTRYNLKKNIISFVHEICYKFNQSCLVIVRLRKFIKFCWEIYEQKLPVRICNSQ